VDAVDVRAGVASLGEDAVPVRNEPLGLLGATELRVCETDRADRTCDQRLAFRGRRRIASSFMSTTCSA
jgi:hypothetical protein